MTCFSTVAAVGLHLASVHSVDGYNNHNPGVFVRDECGFQAGAYYNSERRFSAYAAKTWDLKRVPVWAALGVVTGYRAAPVVPMAMAGVRIGEVRIGYIPKLKGVNDTHVFHIMIEKEF